MSIQTRWLTRALSKFVERFDKQGPERRRRAEAWDYAQADLQPWAAEPDQERLSAALRLWQSAPARAFTELHMLAEQNSPIAINAIGECYYWGNGVATDEEE